MTDPTPENIPIKQNSKSNLPTAPATPSTNQLKKKIGSDLDDLAIDDNFLSKHIAKNKT